MEVLLKNIVLKKCSVITRKNNIDVKNEKNKQFFNNMDLKKKGDKTNNSTYTRVDKDVLNEIRQFAKNSNYSILDIVNLALNEFLKKYEKK